MVSQRPRGAKAIIHVCIGPPEAYAEPPRNAKERYRLQRRLKRIEPRLEASKGTCMNMDWLGWFDQWTTVWEALGSQENPYEGMRNE